MQPTQPHWHHCPVFVWPAYAEATERNRMNTATIKRFFTILSSVERIGRERLYQLLLKAESRYYLKDYKGQFETGLELERFAEPINIIGGYYQASHLNLTGQRESACEKLIMALESKMGYADKARLRLSSIKVIEGDLDEALRLRLTASRSEAWPLVIESKVGVASLLGATGDHLRAIELLESALPLIEKLGAHPLYFDLLNSLAVEYGEVGRIEEAARIIAPVVESPYAAFYPNWAETEREIADKSETKPTVLVEKAPLAEIESVGEEGKAKVLTFPSPKGLPVSEIECALAAFQVESPEAEECEQEPDTFPYHEFLTRKFGLREKLEDWMHGVMEPDDLGTLMVVLAECRNPLERDMILEQVIEVVFSHTDDSSRARSKWRSKILSKVKV
jgi:tetratricopeptide (TPR) repeat protein